MRRGAWRVGVLGLTMALLACAEEGAKPASGEVVVGRCEPLRFAAERGTFAQTFAGLQSMSPH